MKNLTGDTSDSITRKVKEWWKSWQLETSLSKDEILGAYLNIIYVGPNMYGVETGSQYYFSKTCAELSLEECAFLAGMNNAPNTYNPFGEKDNTEKIKKRTKTVLTKMLELNYIDENAYNDAISSVDKGLKFKKTKIEEDITDIINKMWEEYELTPNNAGSYPKPENVSLTQRRVNVLRTDIKELGSVNVDSIEEYKKLKDRYDFMCEQRLDLDDTMAKLRNVIQDMTETMKKQFREKFEVINKNFGEVFKELFGGGMAEVILTDEANILECGIDITVQPPGKKLQNMTLLSGGEKAFTAIALLFAILRINPAPFCVLDEIEAALDDVNVYRYAEYLKKFAKDTQFLVITHRKGTMEVADTVYGVTMEEKGISKMLSMKLK